jgi:hypothetical protein
MEHRLAIDRYSDNLSEFVPDEKGRLICVISYSNNIAWAMNLPHWAFLLHGLVCVILESLPRTISNVNPG